MTCDVCGIRCEGYDGGNVDVCDDGDRGDCWVALAVALGAGSVS